jgi:hypothetical protein
VIFGCLSKLSIATENVHSQGDISGTVHNHILAYPQLLSHLRKDVSFLSIILLRLPWRLTAFIIGFPVIRAAIKGYFRIALVSSVVSDHFAADAHRRSNARIPPAEILKVSSVMSLLVPLTPAR